mgnify:CR=1 FL=1
MPMKESGIVISNDQNGAQWLSKAETLTDARTLYPTSTVDANVWYHSSSSDASSANSGDQPYSYVVQESDGVGASLYSKTTDATFVDGKSYYTKSGNTFTKDNTVVAGNPISSEYYEVQTDATASYYQLNKFYIKSATTSAVNKQLIVDSVTISGVTNSAELDKSLRVLVKCSGFTKIYCLSGATTSYNVGPTAGNTATALVVDDDGSKNLNVTGANSVPATTPLEADIYCYFEGEDENCISDNVKSSLDQLTISVSFKTAA